MQVARSEKKEEASSSLPIRTVCLASGRGSNFQAVWQGIEEGRIANCRIAALIVDRPDTGAELFARKKGVAVRVIDFHACQGKQEFGQQLQQSLTSLAPDLILALGFMRILSRSIVERFREKIINIHPSLLPAFPGMQAQRQALRYGVKVSGATVHFVDEGLDTGPIILQRAVAVEPQESLEELTARILQTEHAILVEAVDLFCRRLIEVEGGRVRIAIGAAQGEQRNRSSAG